MRRIDYFVLLLCTIMIIPGCVSCPQLDPQQTLIMRFNDQLIPLAKAVDAVADKLPVDSKDQQIFDEVVRKSANPNLIKTFDGYVLKARIEEGVGVILLCSPDGKDGIIEDVSCTTRPDSYRPPRSPCEYLLDVKRVCSEP